eukprot:TRINITY_DN68545_c0_g1_i1.p1 TRINITY_DN68545_c0_g1~~TRINITY_DN68545_c0_g1_i1.p1  ORF type:complete len:169 (-),score=50.92 TRINITY_DN68545_c0_g1_i1:89-595(-)
MCGRIEEVECRKVVTVVSCYVFFFSSRRRHTRCREVSWARRCVQETVTEHRVLDYNCIDTIDYNDKAVMFKNLLNLKGDQKLKDLIKENKGIPEPSKPSEEDKNVQETLLEYEVTDSKEDSNLEEELKKVEETDALARVLNLFSKHCSDATILKELLSSWEKEEIVIQ